MLGSSAETEGGSKNMHLPVIRAVYHSQTTDQPRNLYTPTKTCYYKVISSKVQQTLP